MKQYSLFVKHEAPIEVSMVSDMSEEPAIEETVNKVKLIKKEKPIVKTKSVGGEENLISLTQLEKDRIDNFKIEECFCGSRKLEKVGNIFLCKKCGNEFNIGGVLFGEKYFNKEKQDL